MKKVRAPKFLDNLYRDMRDRHLLLPALALIIGVLAVPILLKSHNDAHSAPPTSASGGTQANSATPAVVRQELGVTNYKKRLDRLQSKNPFHQQYTAPPESAQAQAAPSASVPSTSSSGTATAPAPTTGSSTVPPASTTSPPVSSSSSTGSPSSTSGTKPTLHVFTYRVSVKVGEANDLKERNEVSSLALLPSKHKPILSFLEANGKQALFLVSTDVDSVSGDGRCVPRPLDCQYLIMRPGDKAHFDYAPDGKRYNLVLVDIHAAEIGHKLPPGLEKKSGDLKQKFPLLGDG